jgi:hypothetical protein
VWTCHNPNRLAVAVKTACNRQNNQGNQDRGRAGGEEAAVHTFP